MSPRPSAPVVLDQRSYARMRDILGSVVRDGTGRRAAVSGLSVGGKTGTTNDFRDAWFAGYAGELVTTVWVGNDDNSPTDRVTGGGAPARIFSAYMQHAPRQGLGAENLANTIAALPEAPTAEVAGEIVDDDEAETADNDSEDPIASFLSALGGN